MKLGFEVGIAFVEADFPAEVASLKERVWEEEGICIPFLPPINLETKAIVAF